MSRYMHYIIQGPCERLINDNPGTGVTSTFLGSCGLSELLAQIHRMLSKNEHYQLKLE